MKALLTFVAHRNILGELGTPDFMSVPPKEVLVEKASVTFLALVFSCKSIS